jgi:capsule polysaccharide export protein KpsE/RkpR
MMKLNKFKFKKLDKKQIMDITYVIIILLVLGLFYYTYNKAEKYENFYQPLWVEAEKEKKAAIAAIKAAEEAKAAADAGAAAERKRKEEEAKKFITIFGVKIPKLI